MYVFHLFDWYCYLIVRYIIRASFVKDYDVN